MRAFLVAAAFVAAPVTATFAATYNDFASFDAAVNISVTEDFESAGTGVVFISAPWTGPSGITVSSQGNNNYIAPPGQSTNPTTAFGSNFPEEDTLTFDLAGTFDAFGADFYQNLNDGAQGTGPASFLAYTYLGGVQTRSFSFSVDPNGGSFFGFDSTGLFDTVEVQAVSGSIYEVVDNISLGSSVAPVPLPAGLPLLAAGLGSLLMAKRRARRS